MPREGVRLLDRHQVRAIGHRAQPGMRNARVELPGVRGWAGRVVFAHHDQRGCPDARNLGKDVEASESAYRQLAHSPGRLERDGQCLVDVAAIGDGLKPGSGQPLRDRRPSVAFELVESRPRVTAGPVRGRADQDEPLEPLRKGESKALRDHASERQAGDVCALDSQGVHELRELTRVRMRSRIGRFARLRFSESLPVVGDHAERLRKGREHLVPYPTRAGVAVQQQQGLPTSGFDVVKGDATDSDERHVRHPVWRVAVECNGSPTPLYTAVAGSPGAAQGVQVQVSERLGRWRGKAVLVTGATAGIGWAIARALASIGMRVALVARDRERLERRCSELESLGVESLAVATDVARRGSIPAMFGRVRAEWGPLDVLVNNAGIVWRERLIDMDPGRLDALVDVNQRAAALAMREAVREMQGKSDAAIVNVCSLAGHRVPPPARRATVYAATKHALRALTEGLRMELQALGSPIKVSLVSPGLTDSELHDKAEPSGRYPGYPFRPLDPGDVADAVLYVLSTPAHVQVSDIVIRSIEQPD